LPSRSVYKNAKRYCWICCNSSKKQKLCEDFNGDADSSAAQKSHWEKRVEEISKKEMILEENMKTLFSIIWGQVSEVLKHRIQDSMISKQWTVRETLWHY